MSLKALHHSQFQGPNFLHAIPCEAYRAHVSPWIIDLEFPLQHAIPSHFATIIYDSANARHLVVPRQIISLRAPENPQDFRVLGSPCTVHQKRQALNLFPLKFLRQRPEGGIMAMEIQVHMKRVTIGHDTNYRLCTVPCVAQEA